MPLIQIVRNPDRVFGKTFERLLDMLPGVAATQLTCSDGGLLKPEDIMIEVSEFSPHDRNCKDIHIRVIAHDYPSRKGRRLERLEVIGSSIAGPVERALPKGTSWYVWVLLSPTSYNAGIVP